MKNFAAARRLGYSTNQESFINPNSVEQIVENYYHLKALNSSEQNKELWGLLFSEPNTRLQLTRLKLTSVVI